MKCTNCEYEAMNNFEYCPNCGTKTVAAESVAAEPVAVNPAYNIVLSAVKDVMFLIICILLSASVIFSLANDGMPVITILLAVFMWIVYANGTKNNLDSKQLRNISGTVYANYVVNNVAFIIVLVCGFIVTAVLLAASTSAEYIKAFTDEFLSKAPEVNTAIALLLAHYSWALGLLFAVIGGAGLAINICGMRKIHMFAKSLYMGVDAQTAYFPFAKAAKNWLMVFAVFEGLNVASEDISAMLLAACNVAAIILAIILINKYFVKPQVEQ